MLRLIGKVIAAGAAAAATTYVGSKFMQWAGIIRPKAKKRGGDSR